MFYLTFFYWVDLLSKSSSTRHLWTGLHLERSPHRPFLSCHSWGTCPFIGVRCTGKVLVGLVLPPGIQGCFLSEVDIDLAVWGRHSKSTTLSRTTRGSEAAFQKGTWRVFPMWATSCLSPKNTVWSSLWLSIFAKSLEIISRGYIKNITHTWE